MLLRECIVVVTKRERVANVTFWGLVRDRTDERRGTAMPLMSTPRRGMSTRSSGDTEQMTSTAGAERMSGDIGGETSSAEALLRTVMEELKQMREERALQLQQQKDLAILVRQREEELRRLRENNNQLSLSNNSAANVIGNMRVQNDLPLESETVVIAGERVTSRTLFNGEPGFKLKPDTYDGSTSLREFFSQFNLIARANQ